MRLLFAIALLGAVFAEDAWKAANVDRTIDATSQIVKVSTLYSFENVGNGPQSKVLIALSKEESATLSFISAGIDGSKGKLKISEKPAEKDLAVYEVDLRTPVAKGAKVTIRINLRITQVLEPLPSKIQQSDSQFVVLHTSAYVPSLYETVTQKTTIRTTQGGKLLSATTVSPSKQETERVIYGPYVNIPAFETKPVKVHYENNSPFVIATIVERFIEVSHWGNIAVEEYIELVHKGAELDGPFSRIDYQMDRRGRRQPALQQFTTVLPAQAKDIYYRDEIGNISTSAVRIRADSVDVEIRPRFPLFGGWKTSYVIGYNLPSEEYLYSKGNQYALKTKLFDHVFNDIVVEKLRTKVLLPEHVKRVKVATPYAVDRRPEELKPTYLDTTGRLVLVLEKENIVPDHSQFFTVTYEFEFVDMLREPLLASAFFFSLFFVIIVYSRFDFTISSDPAKDAEERSQIILGNLAKSVDSKQSAYEDLIEASQQYKSTKNDADLQEAKKTFIAARNQENSTLTDKIATLKTDSGASAAEKASELLKYDKTVFDAVDNYLKAVEKSTTKTAGTEEQQFLNKVKDARNRADSVLASI
ncbi:Dolichyl-diphosphooligosaccharide--protein glycosyltransferase subunit 1 [Caenorhabditis elegans]|uniref:Dolichyl-diphosphooligosaccharide--protein glycosyltransferase subunit 1 n=1 Tax=Caenorhabditis elegans TaxID=6239 RepID=RPN1_CAEEL|nr:Dolichyl-diphosphooligosaccharide--protein glycosyltransferase subunit 1 [Caenorhabditis elegans]Q9GZH4.2 RecName: Full=Dolichyl-diphosphooligosaccharide--protein glycosyltransferase subunit 1; AltName: Full=Ribophorin I; Short=RPN-I; Flags: Precursor [Caenorhabditis elegans]CCD62020.1 Dolichyl-diphosphooligosaccharide--protein glycosyltransferase subunit 1 [Caenorhabditis elegans]|eukprot:NP_501065.2 Dolichyl-diphosphooligosaccharide--protein glycosyltransferase subunit 1 [Caenorhabditis elegans]